MIRSNLHYPTQTTHKKNTIAKAAGFAPSSCHFYSNLRRLQILHTLPTYMQW